MAEPRPKPGFSPDDLQRKLAGIRAHASAQTDIDPTVHRLTSETTYNPRSRKRRRTRENKRAREAEARMNLDAMFEKHRLDPSVSQVQSLFLPLAEDASVDERVAALRESGLRQGLISS